MPSLAVVEDLEVLEDGVGQLQASSPASAVEQLDLHAGPEGLDDDGVDSPIGRVKGFRGRGGGVLSGFVVDDAVVGLAGDEAGVASDVHPPRPIGPTRRQVDLTDELQQHRVAHGASGQRPSPPGAEARHRDPDPPCSDLDGIAVAYDGGDDLGAPVGSVCSFNNSKARLVTASSVSKSRMRRRAAANSADSAVVTPGSEPATHKILASPVEDGLARHAELLGNLSDRPA